MFNLNLGLYSSVPFPCALSSEKRPASPPVFPPQEVVGSTEVISYDLLASSSPDSSVPGVLNLSSHPPTPALLPVLLTPN